MQIRNFGFEPTIKKQSDYEKDTYGDVPYRRIGHAFLL